MHADGGATSQIFVPPQVFATAAGPHADTDPPAAAGSNGNLYAVVAGKLYPDAVEVRPRVLPILGATTEAIMYAHCRAELGNLYGQARLAGMRFHLTALPADVEVSAETLISIDPVAMQKLYQCGEEMGAAGPAWAYAPPDICSPAGPYVERKHKWK
jgi:hypothetical protein